MNKINDYLQMTRLKYTFFIFLSFYSFTYAKGEPKWFLTNNLKGYTTSDYYIGVGSGLSFSKAQEEAQAIIAGQLEVSIESSINSSIVSIEENENSYLKDTFVQNTESIVSLSVNGIEVIESEKYKLTHYVFAVLDKQKYSSGLKVELDGLMNSMVSYQASANIALNNNNIFASIQHYLDLQQIVPAFYSKKSFYNSISDSPYIDNPDLSLDKVISEIGKIISGIKFDVISGDKQSALSGRPLPKPIIIKGYHRNLSVPLIEMPLIVKYKNGEVASRGSTDKNGNFDIYINAISNGNKREKIIVTPNFSSLQSVFKKYLKNTSLSVTYGVTETAPISFDISIKDKDGNTLTKLENKLLKSIQKLGHYASENSDLLLSGVAHNVDTKEVEGKNGVQFLVKSELDLILSTKEGDSKLSTFTIVGKGLSNKSIEDANKKSYQKFKIGQRGLSEILSSAEDKLNKVFYNSSKINFEKGEGLYSNKNYKEALRYLALVTHDEDQSERAMSLISKIHIKIDEIEIEKYKKIEEKKRIEREHELSLARIAAEKKISISIVDN